MKKTYFELIKGYDEIKAREMDRAQNRDLNPTNLLSRGLGCDVLEVIGKFDTLEEARAVLNDFTPSCRYCSGPVPFYALEYAYIDENIYSIDEDGEEEFESSAGGWDVKATFPFVEWNDLSDADLSRWGYWSLDSWGNSDLPEDAEDIVYEANEAIDDYRKDFVTTEVNDEKIRLFSEKLWEHYCKTGKID